MARDTTTRADATRGPKRKPSMELGYCPRDRPARRRYVFKDSRLCVEHDPRTEAA